MKTKIAIIGAGNMGAAIISGIQKDNSVSVCEADKRRAQFLKRKFKVILGDLKKVVKRSQIIILAVKPQNFEELLMEMQGLIKKDQLIISIAAGITTHFIEDRLGKVKVVRAMPNLPAQVGLGITAIAKGKFAKQIDLKRSKSIFDTIGETLILDEKWIDSVTAVSGSGPAYVFLFVECMIKAAQTLGLKKKDAERLVKQTLLGSVRLLESEKEEASKLRARVTSKGGTTQAAMDVFFANKIDILFEAALKAAESRAKELAI